MATCGVCKQSRSNAHIRWHYQQRYSSTAPSPQQATSVQPPLQPETTRHALRTAAEAALVSQRRAARKATLPPVPDGYYAVPDAGTLQFFRVSRTRKNWLRLQVQASDSLHEIRNYGHKVSVLHAINSDIPGARAAYAANLGRCYRCGRTLTDAESRANGIGPICAGLQYA